MKKTTKADREAERRRAIQIDPVAQKKQLARQIIASRTQNSFFNRTCGRPFGRYHLLSLILVAVALLVYILRQNKAAELSGKKLYPDNSHFKPNYLTNAEREQISAALKSTGGDFTNLLGLMHQFASKIVSPGEILFPLKARGGIHLMPLPFCAMPDGRIRGPEDMQRYQEAKRWLKERRDIMKMTPKMFVANLKVLNRKITGAPDDSHDFRSRLVWLNKEGSVGLFGDLQLLEKLLSPEDFTIALGIRDKVEFICSNVAAYNPEDAGSHVRESVMIDLMRGEHGDLERMAQSPSTREQLKRLIERRLTKKEKQLVKRLYDIKEERTPAEHAQLLEQDFAEFLQTEGDIITRAGKLQFLILKAHGFGDGNGRCARAMTDEFLDQHGMPPIFYHDREAYHRIASRAVVANDPEILIWYLRQQCDGQKYLQTMNLAAEIQDECVDKEGGSDKCDGILLNVISRSGKGFC